MLFTDVSGLLVGDDVRIAGVRVGSVEAIERTLPPLNLVYIAGVQVGRVTAVKLAGDRVRVSMRIRDAWIGGQTNASIEIKGLLGAKSVSLDPRRERALDPRTIIPLQRTAMPYDVVQALNGLSGTLQKIDTGQLEQVSLGWRPGRQRSTLAVSRLEVDVIKKILELLALKWLWDRRRGRR